MKKEKEFKIDPQYQVINRSIDTNEVSNIKATSLNFIYSEELENNG